VLRVWDKKEELGMTVCGYITEAIDRDVAGPQLDGTHGLTDL